MLMLTAINATKVDKGLLDAKTKRVWLIHLGLKFNYLI